MSPRNAGAMRVLIALTVVLGCALVALAIMTGMEGISAWASCMLAPLHHVMTWRAALFGAAGAIVGGLWAYINKRAGR